MSATATARRTGASDPALAAIARERRAITRALKPVPPVVALLLAGALLARLAQVETAVLAGALPWEAS